MGYEQELTLVINADSQAGMAAVAALVGGLGQAAGAADVASASIAGVGTATAATSATVVASAVSIGDVFAGIGTIIAAVGLDKFLQGTVKDASAAQASTARLKVSIDDTGASYGRYSGAIEQTTVKAAALGFTHQDTIQSLGSLTTMTGSASKALSLESEAQDLAAFTGKGLAFASTMVARVEEGKIGIAARYLPFLSAQMTAEQAQAVLRARVSGQAAELAKQEAGANNVWKASTNELSIEIGNRLLPAITGLEQEGSKVIDWFISLDPATKNAIEDTAALAAGVLLLGGAVKTIQTVWTVASGVIAGAEAAKAAAVAASSAAQVVAINSVTDALVAQDGAYATSSGLVVTSGSVNAAGSGLIGAEALGGVVAAGSGDAAVAGVAASGGAAGIVALAVPAAIAAVTIGAIVAAVIAAKDVKDRLAEGSAQPLTSAQKAAEKAGLSRQPAGKISGGIDLQPYLSAIPGAVGDLLRADLDPTDSGTRSAIADAKKNVLLSWAVGMGEGLSGWWNAPPPGAAVAGMLSDTTSSAAGGTLGSMSAPMPGTPATMLDSKSQQAIHTAEDQLISAEASANKTRLDAQESFNKSMADAQYDFNKSAASLRKSFLDQEASAWDSYDKSLKTEADKIANSTPLFDAIKQQTNVSAETLVTNINGQVQQLQQWQGYMADLAKRGVSKAILGDIADLGPGNIANVAALATASNSDLAQWEKLYGQRAAVGKAVAPKTATEEDQLAQTKKTIATAQEAYSQGMSQLQSDLAHREADIRLTLNKALQGATDTVVAAEKKLVTALSPASGEKAAEAIVGGLAAGVRAGTPLAAAAMQSIAEYGILLPFYKALAMHSPSLKMYDGGMNAAAGAIYGILALPLGSAVSASQLATMAPGPAWGNAGINSVGALIVGMSAALDNATLTPYMVGQKVAGGVADGIAAGTAAAIKSAVGLSSEVVAAVDKVLNVTPSKAITSAAAAATSSSGGGAHAGGLGALSPTVDGAIGASVGSSILGAIGSSAGNTGAGTVFQLLAAGAGKGANIIEALSHYLGVPYLWGGTTPAGFDCSGLEEFVGMHFFGLKNMPRTAEEQYQWLTKMGRGVSLKNLAVGDQVFFGAGPNSIHHTGTYAGDGKMINAPYTGANVRYDSVYQNDLYGAGRWPGFRSGGMANGPSSGYLVALHGYEGIFNADQLKALSSALSGGGHSRRTVNGPLIGEVHLHDDLDIKKLVVALQAEFDSVLISQGQA